MLLKGFLKQLFYFDYERQSYQDKLYDLKMAFDMASYEFFLGRWFFSGLIFFVKVAVIFQ